VAYDWDFGDNTAGSGATVTHTYTAGTYTVTLTVTDDMGATNSTTLSVDIAATTVPQAPIADAGGPYTAEVGATVQFDGSASTDSDGTIASYSWDFGDGTAAGTGVGPVHIYTAAGSYPVVLTVTDDQGQTGTAQTTAEITEVTPPQPQQPEPQPQAGEKLYKDYCVSCHGAGGKGGSDGDVVGESADDVAEAIEEESDMQFLADVLSNSDIEAIAAYLNNDDHKHDGEHGDEDHKHDGKHGDEDKHDDGKKDGDKKEDSDKDNGKGQDSSSNTANPFANEADGSQSQNAAADAGGGALHWLILFCFVYWVAIRKRIMF
jgi:PKD repeat protein